MENNSNDFDSFVMRGILLNDKFKIKRIEKLKSIKSLYFTDDVYKIIVALIKEKNIIAIQNIADLRKTDEFLEIMSFVNEDGAKFIVTIYDSNALMQDPQIIEIFKQ